MNASAATSFPRLSEWTWLRLSTYSGGTVTVFHRLPFSFLAETQSYAPMRKGVYFIALFACQLLSRKAVFYVIDTAARCIWSAWDCLEQNALLKRLKAKKQARAPAASRLGSMQLGAWKRLGLLGGTKFNS